MIEHIQGPHDGPCLCPHCHKYRMAFWAEHPEGYKKQIEGEIRDCHIQMARHEQSMGEQRARLRRLSGK